MFIGHSFQNALVDHIGVCADTNNTGRAMKLQISSHFQWRFFLFKFLAKLGKLPEIRMKIISSSGNQTPASNVTGGDTYHYTTDKCVMFTL